MKAVEIRKDIYWVGAIDWSMRSFHGYETSRGSSYNAYLILDEKITLIDTVKEPFKEELLERVASVIDPAKIDYIISNHVEPDHSGALPFMMAHCPNATIITSIPQGLKGLKARYGDMTYEGVKAGDTLSIGKRTLQFVPTPMLHWPDSMVTYCPASTTRTTFPCSTTRPRSTTPTSSCFTAARHRPPSRRSRTSPSR